MRRTTAQSLSPFSYKLHYRGKWAITRILNLVPGSSRVSIILGQFAASGLVFFNVTDDEHFQSVCTFLTGASWSSAFLILRNQWWRCNLSFSLSLFFPFSFPSSFTHTYVRRCNDHFIRVIKKSIPIISMNKKKVWKFPLMRPPLSLSINISLYLFGFLLTFFFRASSPVDDRSPCGSDVMRCETHFVPRNYEELAL